MAKTIFVIANLVSGLDSGNPIAILNLIVAGIIIGLALAEMIDRKVSG